jgi:hypothetical protein
MLKRLVRAALGLVGLEAIRLPGYERRLLSFEPVEQLCKELKAAAAGDSAWTTHRLALGREPGFFDINVTRHDVFSSFSRADRLRRQALQRRGGSGAPRARGGPAARGRAG